jgi:translation initiation factor 2B subunit (eIF-2B alpha/beta/delta family)
MEIVNAEEKGLIIAAIITAATTIFSAFVPLRFRKRDGDKDDETHQFVKDLNEDRESLRRINRDLERRCRECEELLSQARDQMIEKDRRILTLEISAKLTDERNKRLTEDLEDAQRRRPPRRRDSPE